MRVSHKLPKQEIKTAIYQNTTFFPLCCPQKDSLIAKPQISQPCKPKFLNVTLSKQKSGKTRQQFQSAERIASKPIQQTNPDVVDFELDKSDFLDQIRRFTPKTEKPGSEENSESKKTPDHQQIKQNHPSQHFKSILQDLSNDIFSQMFVSSTIKGRIVLNGSLGSISQVHSHMEISCPTQRFSASGSHSYAEE